MANWQTTKKDLESAEDTIKQLENKVKDQLLQIEECEGKRKTNEVDLCNLELKYTSTLAERDQICNGNEMLHKEKQELQNIIESLQARITLHDQDREQKLAEIKKLEIQFADERKAKQIRQSALSTLQKDLHSLKKQNSEKEKEIECIIEKKTAEIKQISEKLVEERNKSEELQSHLNSVTLEKKKLEDRNEDISQEISTLCQSLVKDLKSTELEKSCDHSLLEEDSDGVTDPSKMIDIVRSSHALAKGQIDLLSIKILELTRTVKETGKENETLLVAKTQLEDALCRLQKESETIQVDRNSLVKELQTSRRDLELKSSKIEALENGIDELQQQKKQLKEAIEVKEEEYIVLHTKKEVMDKKRVSLEDEVGRLQSKLGNTIIELTNVKTINDVLESNSAELISANSSLLDGNVSLQNKLNEAEKQSEKLLEQLSLKENEITKMKTETSMAKKEKIATEKSLEQKESEISHLKDDLKELEKHKCDLENERSDLKKINKQMENVYEDLQLTNSQIQADNSKMKRELECERAENLTKTTSLQSELGKALTSLEEQNCKLSQLQDEKNVVQNQLLEAEKELTVLMEDNANMKHQMYRNKETDKDELLTIKCQV
jgi:chromosome segregation ATPase